MFFQQYHLSCVSLFSYLIGDSSTGRAVVVDPQRDISGYLDDAQEGGEQGDGHKTSGPRWVVR